LLSFPRSTEMFQFPRFPLPALCVQTGVTPHDGCRVSPFGHLRVKAWSTARRSFSQSPTSFIGSWRQGIHRWPFVAWKNKQFDARARSAVLKGQEGEWAGAAEPLGLDADGHSLTTEERTRSRALEAAGGKPTTAATRASDPPVHQLGVPHVIVPVHGWLDTVRNSSLERR
jgi:hypothetical protein